jgi:hypothetical protein
MSLPNVNLLCNNHLTMSELPFEIEASNTASLCGKLFFNNHIIFTNFHLNFIMEY